VFPAVGEFDEVSVNWMIKGGVPLTGLPVNESPDEMNGVR